MTRTAFSPRTYYTDDRVRQLIRTFAVEVEASRGKPDTPLLSNILPIIQDIFNDYSTTAEGWMIEGFLIPLLSSTCPGNILYSSGFPVLHSGLLHPKCPSEVLSMACCHHRMALADIAVQNENCSDEDAVYVALRRAAEQEG